MEKQTIKENYHNFLAQYRYMYSDESIMSKPEIKYQYNQVFEELMDTSRKSVGRLTEDETETLRKYIGVYGEEATWEVAPTSFWLKPCAAAITTRIKHGYIPVKDALLSGKITYEELSNLKLIEIDYPLDTENHVWLLHDNGIITVKDFIKRYGFFWFDEDYDHDHLVDYIHSLGLILKEEETDSQIVKKVEKQKLKLMKAKAKLLKEQEEVKTNIKK